MKISWLQYFKMLVKGRSVVQEAVRQGVIVKNVHSQSSFKSTEFITAVLASLGAVLAQAAGIIPAPYALIVTSVSTGLYSLSRGLAKSGDPLGGVKPGETTSELWLNLLTQIGNIAASAAGAVSPETAAILMMVSNGAYGLSRGLAKGGAQPLE